MAEVVWFPVYWDTKRNMELKEAAAPIIDWLDDQKIYYEWLGIGREIEGKFRVAINFPDSKDAVLAKLIYC